jgi:hypothetical protein
MEYPNTGSLFPNKYKKLAIHPNTKGTIKVDRQLLKELMAESNESLIELEISGWTKEWTDEGGTTTKFLSLKVAKPYKKNAAPAQDDDNDPIPF